VGVGLASAENSVLDLFVNYGVQLSSSFTSHTVYAGLAVKV